MPTKKYRVDTDRGSFEVEVEEADSVSAAPGERTRVDTNMIGVDPNWMVRKSADVATRYLPSWAAPTAATTMAAIGSLPLSFLEAASSPEAAAAGMASGARLPRMPKRVLPTSYGGTPIRDALRTGGEELSQAPGGGMTAKVVGWGLQKIPARKTFQDVPLAEQMADLPARGRSVLRTRTGGGTPPVQGGINDLPLHQQMAHLPRTGGVASSRAVSPPTIPQTPFHERPLYQQMADLPATPAPQAARGQMPPYQPTPPAHPPGAPPMSEAAVPSAPSGVSDDIAAALRAKGLDPARVIGPGTSKGVPLTSVGRRDQPLRRALGIEPSDTRMGELTQKLGGQAPEPPHPLQAPRFEQGAERVGKPLGVTKEEIRQTVGPRLDETRGEASPVLPDRALRDIIEAVKALPKGGPERLAYVARATSGKTRWQVENIRRTLEHLGLIVPVAVGLGRKALIGQMQGQSAEEGR